MPKFLSTHVDAVVANQYTCHWRILLHFLAVWRAVPDGLNRKKKKNLAPCESLASYYE